MPLVWILDAGAVFPGCSGVEQLFGALRSDDLHYPMQATEQRWGELCRAAELQVDLPHFYGQLVAAWSEPARHYHTLAHLDACLVGFDEVRGNAVDALAVEFAVWFHDAVYDPQAPDNEERSAAMAVAFLQIGGCSTERVQKVERLILATKTHDITVDEDAPLLMDVDLSILGQSPERFFQYEREIREEYAWVPAAIYGEKRAAILKGFLQRESVYQMPVFRDRYEEQARRNIAASIEQFQQLTSSAASR